ncbi:MAG: precorrin-6y C5,15-methyltransferase (decarboxylating) subunit CbiE [Candidatus Brocadiaceae bacterium]|nr:precorrin-6y C5,15-methyltransferase (decarboxylating) subunit CbiE [Candidatus Brocadiaceae bacterium]
MAEQNTNKVIIVGCGPGIKGYISPKALYNIKKADILVGSLRLLKLFPGINVQKIVLEKNYRQLVDMIARRYTTKQVVVLVSGDPCFFSYTKMIVKKLGPKSCTIIPGVSSIQLAFASIGECWEDACFISLHGRKTEYGQLIKKVREYSKVGILTDRINSPSAIARQLLEAGIQKRKMFVCENLSLPEENVREFDLSSALKTNTNGSTVIIIVNNKK